jgi:hypothetical protein
MHTSKKFGALQSDATTNLSSACNTPELTPSLSDLHRLAPPDHMEKAQEMREQKFLCQSCCE